MGEARGHSNDRKRRTRGRLGNEKPAVSGPGNSKSPCSSPPWQIFVPLVLVLVFKLGVPFKSVPCTPRLERRNI